MMKKYVFLLTVLFSLFSCNDNNKVLEVEHLASQELIPDSMLRKPSEICLTDKNILISNLDLDTIIDVFDYKGNYINRFLPKGQGPKEALFVVHMQYDRKNNCVYAPDVRKNSLYCFSNITNKPQIETIFKYECAPNDSVYLNNWWGKLANNEIIAGNSSSGGMLAHFSANGTFMDFHEPLPDKKATDERLSDWANGSLYTPTATVSPEGKKAAFVYSYADILTIAQLTPNGQLVTKSIRKQLPNDIEAIQYGEHVVAGAISPRTIMHYASITSTEKNIYALHIGIPYKDLGGKKMHSSTIRVFDWKGNTCKIIKLDKPVQEIKVTPDGKTLYAINESENGYSILRYEM